MAGGFNRTAVGAAVVILALAGGMGAAQLVRPSLANPPTQPQRTLAAQLGHASPAAIVIDRSCGDCHSNATRWPGYAKVAPLSWVMAEAVSTGRRAVNFSEWASYPAAQQQALLAQSCADASAGKMPGSAWTSIHPEARLSAADIEAICAAARQG